jgi:hypothetical protein
MEVQDNTSAAIYSEAKSEYTKQLVFNFQPVLLRFFLDRYAETKTSASVTSKAKSALSEFQESLSQIPEWNLDKVRKETTTLLDNVHCDYIEDLITAVFIAHTKILSAIRLNVKPRRRIQITVPKPDHFMHRCLSECSRLMWSNVYLFNDSVSTLDSQKYMTDVNRFLEEGILQAIRNLLPVKSILRDSLQEDEDDGIQITNSSAGTGLTPTVASEEKEVKAEEEKAKEEKAKEKAEEKTEKVNVEKVEAALVPEVIKLEPEPIKVSQTIPVVAGTDTLVVDTEKSVGFTGMDSVFGDSGHAELRPMIEEGDNDLKILGESEALDLGEIEDLEMEASVQTPLPLSADDYEAL